MYNNKHRIVCLKITECFLGSSTCKQRKPSDVQNLVISISKIGLIDPLVVRKVGVMYEIVHGRRRYNALKQLNAKTIPAMVIATEVVSETWLELKLQQEGVDAFSHSEMATLIYVYHRALKKQKRGKNEELLDEIEDINEAKKQYSDDKSGKKFRLSARTISRYLCIYALSESLKQILDEGLLSLRAAVELSYIDPLTQDIIGEHIRKGKAINWEKSKELRKIYCNNVSKKNIFAEKKMGFQLMKKVFIKYKLDKIENEAVEQIVDKALSMYFSKEGNFKISWHNY